MRRTPGRGEASVMIEIASLSKSYGGFTAVDDISFTARPGRVTGFLGPNGAGKSTTMRIMVGLTPPTSGSATIAGRRFADLPNPGLEVGVLLDASAQHAGRTGREILTLAQRTMGLPAGGSRRCSSWSASPVPEADRRVGDYSLGMRQRLGIATALIGDPEVLVLDEPANGLDPAGIRWMRDLLRCYADQGGTVLLSSHLLHEIEVIADDIVVIGTADRLAGHQGRAARRRRHRRPRPVSPQSWAEALAAGPAVETTLAPDGALLTQTPTRRRRAGRLAAGIALTELRGADGAGLEEMFLQLTAPQQRDRAPREGAAA